MKGAMMLVFHTAGVPYRPAGKGSCLDPYFTKGCKKKGAGYVTFHKGNARSEGAATACIQTPGGQGICWPGGASGYNINQFLDA